MTTSEASKRVTGSERISAKELKEFLNLHGIGAKEFAEILGISKQAVDLWITGQREFSVTNSRLVRMFQKYPQLLREF